MSYEKSNPAKLDEMHFKRVLFHVATKRFSNDKLKPSAIFQQCFLLSLMVN